MQDIEKLVLRLKKEKREDAKRAAKKVVNEDPAELLEQEAFLCGIEDAYKMRFYEISEFQECEPRSESEDHYFF